MVVRGRPHTSPNIQHNQFVLSTGEDFTFDLAYLFSNIKIYKKFNFIVLANYKPVPHIVYPILKGTDYLDATPTGSLKPLNSIEVENNTTNRFTVVVPASSFETVGAYDIRVVVLPIDQPPKKRPSAQWRDPGLSLAMTVYYGGADFPTNNLPSIEETETPDDALISVMTEGLFSRTLLIPSRDAIADQNYNFTAPVSLGNAPLKAYFHGDSFGAEKTMVLTNFMVDGVFSDNWAWSQVERLPLIPLPSGVSTSVRTFYPPESVQTQHISFVLFEKPFQDLSQEHVGYRPIDLSNQLAIAK